jgi:hypothetical protein
MPDDACTRSSSCSSGTRPKPKVPVGPVTATVSAWSAMRRRPTPTRLTARTTARRARVREEAALSSATPAHAGVRQLRGEASSRGRAASRARAADVDRPTRPGARPKAA